MEAFEAALCDVIVWEKTNRYKKRIMCERRKGSTRVSNENKINKKKKTKKEWKLRAIMQPVLRYFLLPILSQITHNTFSLMRDREQRSNGSLLRFICCRWWCQKKILGRTFYYVFLLYFYTIDRKGARTYLCMSFICEGDLQEVVNKAEEFIPLPSRSTALCSFKKVLDGRFISPGLSLYLGDKE